MANEDVSRLLLQIDASATLLRQEVNKARNDIDGFADRAESKLGRIDGAFAGLGKGAGLALRGLTGLAAGFLSVSQAAALAVNSTREMERLTAQLEVATGSTAAAGEAFQSLTKFAAETPFTLTQVTEAYIKLKNLGIEPTMERLAAFGNTSAAMGKDLSQFIEAVADAATGEFERLKEFGIRASKEGDKVRFTFQGVTESVEFNSDAITNYLQRIGQNKFGDAMAKQAATIDGKLSNLSDATAELGRALGGLGIGDAAGAGIVGLTRLINDAAWATKGLGDGLSSLAREAIKLFDRAAGVDAPKARGPSAQSISERRRREEEVIRQLPQGSAVRASVEQDYRRRYGIADGIALLEEPEIVVTGSRKVKSPPKGKLPRSTGRTASSGSEFLDPAMQNGWALQQLLGAGTPANIELTNEALQGVADTMQLLSNYNFDIQPISLDDIRVAEDYTRTLTEGLAQAVVYGRNFGDVLKGLAQQIASSGIINLLSGGSLGTSFGASLGGILSIFGGGRETGGSVQPGKAYVVGEKRAEVFVPSTSGYIVPRVPSGQAGSGGGEVRVSLDPGLVVTMIEGSVSVAKSSAGDAIRRATRPRMIGSAGA